MIRKFLLRLLAVMLIAASTDSCKHNNTEQLTAIKDIDTLLPLIKVFHPIFIDTVILRQFFTQYPEFRFHTSEIETFYSQRGMQGAWFNDYGVIEQAGLFMHQLEHFDEEGMKDSVVYYSQLKNLFTALSSINYSDSKSDFAAINFEILLTAEFFVYAQKVWYGLNEKTTRSLDWYIKRKTVPSVSILDSILVGGSNSFTAFEPQFPQYHLLRDYLKKYKKMLAMPWDSLQLPEDIKSLKPGDTLDIIPAIKHRLYILNDMAEIDSSNVYDSLMEVGVKQFQFRHGLVADGTAGEKFFREINCTPVSRIRQIEINMERYRWIQERTGENYIEVNIPEYKLHIYENNEIAWSMNVVVGKASTSTTIFNDELEYIVFSPYWIPTPNIVINEILPSIKSKPGYLKKENMEVVNPSTGKIIAPENINWNNYTTSFPYTIRQKPGGNNSLGWVKFIFPNEHNIYLHDTPSRNLFDKESRGFSHGCIRIQEPMRLAEYLLRNDSTYTKSKIDSLYYLGKETYVALPEHIPVYIDYFTSWVDEQGQLNFRRDIYGHDAKLEQTLFEDH